MYQDQHVILPIFIMSDASRADPVFDTFDKARLKIQDWYLSHGRAMQVANPLSPTHQDLTFFQTGDMTAFQRAIAFVWSIYQQEIVSQASLIPLIFVQGLTREHMGGLGWGNMPYAMVAWDLLEEATQADPQWEENLIGVICHEVGHALGWGHYPHVPHNIMWEWWDWPGVTVPVRANIEWVTMSAPVLEVCPEGP